MKRSDGMTLMELLVCILILSLLAVALGTGMDAAMEIYASAQFESDSAALAGILDTALWDVFTFSRDVHSGPEGLVFTNPDYGVQAGTVFARDGLLCLGREGRGKPLVNSGAYPNLAVTEVNARYLESGTVTLLDGTEVSGRGGVVCITYRIVSTTEPERYRDVEVLIRPSMGKE